MNVELSDQVVQFIRELAPEPRRRMRLALKRLEQGKGDIKPLEGELSSYSRLRVGGMRIIFRYVAGVASSSVRCEFAEHRSIIYELYSAIARQLNP